MAKDKRTLAIIVVVIIALYFIKKKVGTDEEFPTVSEVTAQVANPKALGVASPSGSPVPVDSAVDSATLSTSDQPGQVQDSSSAYVDASKELMTTFENNHRLQIPDFFRGYSFEKIPTAVDSETDGIIAADQADGNTMAIFARKKAPELTDLKKFISTEVAEALEMKIPSGSLEKPEKEEPKPGSGFSDVTVWTVRDNGKVAVIILAKRADNQGIYLNVFSGNLEELQKKEDYYEEQLSQFKAY